MPFIKHAKLLFIVIIYGAVLSTTARASDHRHLSEFVVKFGILEVGRANFDIRYGEGNYALAGSGKTAGLAQWFSQTKGSFNSKGTVESLKPKPKFYRVEVKEKGKPAESVQLAFTDNAVTDVKIKSNKKKKKRGKKNYIVLEDKHKRDVMDPVSTLLLPIKVGNANDGRKVCSKRSPIFDGETRYDIRLRYKYTKPIRTKGYNGNAYVCTMRYVPVAGHRKNHRGVMEMAANKDMEVWLAPMGNGEYFTAIKFRIATKYGTFIAEPLFFGSPSS